jgi:hypothetical protein
MIIKLKIKNKNVELSPAEAEDLYRQLDQVFGKRDDLFPFVPHYDPQPIDTAPKYPNPYPWWGIYPPTTTCTVGDDINAPKFTCLEDLAWNSVGK